MFDAWTGNALIGGLSAQALIRVAFAANRVATVEHICLGRRIRDVAEDAEGGVLLLTDTMDGELLRLTPATRASTSQGTC
jgi:glucose/arabinose dehydrogenase